MDAKSFLYAGLLLMPVCIGARADTVYLSNGDQIDGTIQEDNGTTVVIKTAGGGVRSFRKSDVDSVVYERKSAEKNLRAKIDSATNDTFASKDDGWNAPAGLPGFPSHAKRMDKAKEKIFGYALEKLASPDESVRSEARNDIADLGSDALPYVVAGLQNENVEARSACMRLIGQFGANGKTAIKQCIEILYSAMPEHGPAPEFQVPFIRAIKETLPVITEQRFIESDPKSAQVQDGLRQYIAWYNGVFDRLPAQLGEPKIDLTDKEYESKIKEARALKLEKKTWAPPADVVAKAKSDKEKADEAAKAAPEPDPNAPPPDIYAIPKKSDLVKDKPKDNTTPEVPKTAEDKKYDDIINRPEK